MNPFRRNLPASPYTGATRWYLRLKFWLTTKWHSKFKILGSVVLAGLLDHISLSVQFCSPENVLIHRCTSESQKHVVKQTFLLYHSQVFHWKPFAARNHLKEIETTLLLFLLSTRPSPSSPSLQKRHHMRDWLQDLINWAQGKLGLKFENLLRINFNYEKQKRSSLRVWVVLAWSSMTGALHVALFFHISYLHNVYLTMFGFSNGRTSTLQNALVCTAHITIENIWKK